MVDHPIFGRADEDPARAAVLERQMQRFLDAIQSEFDRLDDFLPPMTDGQSAEDWAVDLRRACEPILKSAKDLGWFLLRADGWHKRNPTSPALERPTAPGMGGGL